MQLNIKQRKRIGCYRQTELNEQRKMNEKERKKAKNEEKKEKKK